jgi:uncharacterized protein YlzI (FlbEa/FlbD family)
MPEQGDRLLPVRETPQTVISAPGAEREFGTCNCADHVYTRRAVLLGLLGTCGVVAAGCAGVSASLHVPIQRQIEAIEASLDDTVTDGNGVEKKLTVQEKVAIVAERQQENSPLQRMKSWRDKLRQASYYFGGVTIAGFVLSEATPPEIVSSEPCLQKVWESELDLRRNSNQSEVA